MDWKHVDEGLIRRGELLLSLDFLEGYDFELSIMNKGKVGRPFKLTDGYIVFLAVVRYLFSMPYRQLEGFTRALSRLIPRLPPIDYSWVRRRTLRLDLSPYESLNGYDACGGWVERVYGRRKKRYVKIHFAVDVKTKEVVAMEVTTDDTHDSEVLPNLIMNASRHRLISEAYMDGAYDKAYKKKKHFLLLWPIKL